MRLSAHRHPACDGQPSLRPRVPTDLAPLPPQLPAPAISSYNPFTRSDSSYGAPAPAPGGIRGWFNDKLRSRNDRSAAGAYEQPLQASSGGRGTRGFGPLDPDEAWDTRVGHEADTYGPGGYYEEQELGMRNDPYTGSGYTMNLASTPGGGGGGGPPAASGYGDTRAHEHEHRGRSRDRDSLGLPSGGGDRGRTANPFDDSRAEPSNISLRGVSPRPIDTNAGVKAGGSGPASDSPTERRSVFRENM